jgi:hypothetical protein
MDTTKLERFVRVMTFGLGVTDNLVSIRNDKVVAELTIIEQAVRKAANENVGVKSLLDDYTNLERRRKLALRENSNRAKCNALVPIKTEAREKAKRAPATAARMIKDAKGFLTKMELPSYWCKKFDHYLENGLPESDEEAQQPDLSFLAEPTQTTLELMESCSGLIATDVEGAIRQWDKDIKPFNDALEKFGDEVQAPALMKKVNQLIEDDPGGPEAKVLEALGEEKFKKRLVKVTQTAEAFGVNNELLSPGEQVAVFSYTAVDYRTMNKHLLKEPQGDNISIMCSQTAAALSNLEPYEGLSVRGEARYPGIDEQYVVGNVFTIKAFWSSGVGFGFEKEYTITINGKTGRDVAGLSNSPHEAEILFAPGSRFKVTERVDESQHVIKVKVTEVL